MTKYKFTIGDVVKLKSGGPAMTVIMSLPIRLIENNPFYEPVNGVRCQWFANDEMKTGDFPEDNLEKNQ